MAFLRKIKDNWYTLESYRQDGKVKQRILRRHGKVKPKEDKSNRKPSQTVATIKEAIIQKHLEHSNKQFEAILLDPPWLYKTEGSNQKNRNRTPYPSMSTIEIRDIPIPDLAKKDSYIFMWVTKDHLPDGFWLFQQWGIQYKQIITWVKVTEKYLPKPTTGHWLRNTCEYCLIGIRGEAKSLHSKGIEQIIDNLKSYNDGIFSGNVLLYKRDKDLIKPFHIHEIIEEFVPKEDRLELFPKAYREGWEQWCDDFEK